MLKSKKLERDLSVSDAVTLLGIAYYDKRKVKAIKACHNRIKHRYTRDTKHAIKNILASRDPGTVLGAGVDAMFEQIEHYKQQFGAETYDEISHKQVP